MLLNILHLGQKRLDNILQHLTQSTMFQFNWQESKIQENKFSVPANTVYDLQHQILPL